MKKQIAVLFVCVVFLLSITACAVSEDKVVSSLGEYEKKEFFTSGGISRLYRLRKILFHLCKFYRD